MLAPDSSWPRPTGLVQLAIGEVHIWRVELAPLPNSAIDPFGWLSPDERSRAARFLSEPAKLQFIAARSALRSILSQYLARGPEKIAFRLGPVGKPALVDAGPAPLFFNLSHSREIALVAVTRSGEIGTDVELVREMATRDQLAERFFHPNEVAALRRLQTEQRALGFFNAWTRKEAFLKATGKGISYGIDRVEVTLAPEELARVLAIDGNALAAKTWSLEAFAPAADYVGAVAMEGRWERLLCFTHGYSTSDPNRAPG